MAGLRKGNAKLLQKRSASEKNLRRIAFLPLETLYQELSATPAGLSTAQADARRAKTGRNVITAGRKNTVLHRLREATVNPFNIVLGVIAVITFFTDVVYAEHPDAVTVSILLLLIVLSSAVAFVQSQRSNKAAEDLTRMISSKASVLRDGATVEIAMDGIVPGDVVHLSAGDMIPADVRFLTAKDAFVAQSALTGESNPVEKYGDIRNVPEDELTDLQNMGFMGTNIISGTASGLVLAIGNETYVGTMAKSLSGDRARNSFERGVDAVSSLLIRLMLVMVPVVFLINGISKGNWGAALMFAVTIAVGLTPEMLPMIMTSTLAKGAVSMSRRKVIVKTLGAIQTFGEMDILCTDKTGTLTEDRIVLEKYMNVTGTEDARILRYAYLNSHFQTGLKNLLDVAIIAKAEANGLQDAAAAYARVDEIPFDFTRRRMSVVLKGADGQRKLITKGAVEEMMSISAYAEMDGQVVPLTDEHRRLAMETYATHNADGLRMIAIAEKNEVPGTDTFSVADECDMVLIGFVGFLDPPKEGVQAAITALREHGVRTVVLTGDTEGVAVKVCSEVGVQAQRYLTGRDVQAMDEPTLLKAVQTCDLFAKLSPAQKERIVKAFQTNGHTVGYLGDGINDAPPLHQADVGISVDSAVDIAKETADIVLLKKDLMVLEEGVLEGRRTFGNIVKYIKMAASGNFGNMISVIVASIFLPFLPMLPVQILTQNLLCDFSQMGIPFDSVDPEYQLKPRKWETRSIKTFLGILGPLSSAFDILCFAAMWYLMGANTVALAPLFHAGWFVFGTLSQVLVIHMIRTGKLPFVQSRAAKPLLLSTALVCLAAVAIGFTGIAKGFEMVALPLRFVPVLAVLLLGYCLSIQAVKVLYVRRFGEWL